MLCTVIWDTYANDERRAMWSALHRLVPPDSRDWSRKGVYAYWDPRDRQLLYVGLATDLPERFAQHNRLVPHSGGNKADKIDAWFENRDRIGFSLLVQAAAVEALDVLYGLSPTLGVESSSISRVAEGQLIELHRLEHGRRPPWNGVGGSSLGARWATQRGRSMIRLLSAADESLFVARRALRDLVSDVDSMRREASVHGARMRTLMESHEADFDEGDDPQERVERISRFLMLRAGKLVDDLADSDAEIRRWLNSFTDVDAQRDEQFRYLQATRELERAAPLERDQEALRFIASLLSDGTAEEVARDAADVLASGYLEQRPRLDA